MAAADCLARCLASYSPALCNPSLAHTPDSFFISWNTTAGVFKTEHHRTDSPHGVDRLYLLVTNNYFDHNSFYRTIDSWVSQFGVSPDPDLNCVFEQKLPGAVIPDDPVLKGTSNKKGWMAFSAEYGEDGVATNRTSELFINLNDNTQLDAAGFSLIGKVVEGYEGTVAKLYSGY
ncbi:hypothetical protein TeGR_g8194, partial [Tetraparma gracilis]